MPVYDRRKTGREKTTAKTAVRHEKWLQEPQVASIRQLASELVLFPDPILHKECGLTIFSGEPLKSIVETMFDKMRRYSGIGLAAIQIGIEQNFFVTAVPGEKETVFIDPIILERSGQQEQVEGCLSLPGVSVSRKRAKICVVQAKDVVGKQFTIEAKGLFAVVVQHELDHCRGILCIDGMNSADAVLNKKPLEILRMLKSSV